MDLHSFFREAVTGQLRTLEDLVERVDSDPQAESDARRLAHSLKGSGTTYGFPEVTHRAGTAEAAPPQDFRHRLEDLIQVMAAITTGPAPSRILVVDDDELITHLLAVRLASPDRVVETAGGLHEALAVLGDPAPEVVIVDLILGDGDGRDLLAELTLTSPSTAVIVTTATQSEELRTVCLAAGAVGFLNKPLDLNALAALVDRCLTRRNGEAVSRHSLIEMFAGLDVSRPVTVAAIVPELHGPGGLGPRADALIVDAVLDALDQTLGPEVVIGRWSDTDLVAFSSCDREQLATQLDRARIRLRNLHPRSDGAVLSISVGVCPGVGDLPVSFESARQTAASAARAGGDRVVLGPRQHNSGTVLLAEDDPLTAAVITHRLELDNLEVTHHRDGLTALKAAGETDFDLVILDIQMPGLDGFELLSRLRAVERYAKTPIVILTAVGSERDVVRGFDLGCDDYVLKPFSPAELTARIRRFTRT